MPRIVAVIGTHSGLPDVTANQHHAQAHAATGADHTGFIPANASSLTLLGGDVAVAAANAYTDVLSVVLAAGTWILWGKLTVHPNNNGQTITAKLWDGATVASSDSVQAFPAASASEAHTLEMVGIVVSNGATAWKMSFTCDVALGATAKAAAFVNGAGNNEGFILALRVA